MTPATRRRVLAASAALAAYAAGSCASQPAEPFNASADTEKLDYARPASQDTPESFAVPTTTRPPRAARSAPRGRSRVAAPRDDSCTLDDIRRMESGNRYDAVSGSGKYRGAYQFDARTWASVGGTGDPAAASPEEQDARAARLYAERGTQPWSVCR